MLKFIILWTVGIFAAAMPALAQDAAAAPAPLAPKVRIVLAGDSTTAVGSGWGPGFINCLTGDAQCTNMARGGRSSKSFIAEGLWKKCLDLKPDYVLIQFGHNDQPGHGADRETDPDTTYRAFMTQYVDDARAAGIKPVLITPLSRRQWGADGKIHSTLEPNAQVVREIAAEKHVPLIDLHALSIALYERIGVEACDDMSPPKMTKGTATQPAVAMGEFDGTHLNAKGAAVIGPMVAKALIQVVPDLKPFFKPEAIEKAEPQSK